MHMESPPERKRVSRGTRLFCEQVAHRRELCQVTKKGIFPGQAMQQTCSDYVQGEASLKGTHKPPSHRSSPALKAAGAQQGTLPTVALEDRHS